MNESPTVLPTGSLVPRESVLCTDELNSRPTTPATDRDWERQLQEMNAALLVSSVRQHELTEQAQKAEAALRETNAELQSHAEELNRVNSDLVNLLGSIQTAIVMLGPDLRVRRFTPTAEKLLNLIPADVGRPLADIELNLDGLPDLEPLLTEVIDTASIKEYDVRDEHGRWYSMRLHPYKTPDDKIDGVVVLLVDVDALKRAHAYTESIVATVREPLLVLDQNLRVQTASRSFYENFHVAPEDTANRLLFDLGGGQWNIPRLRTLLEEVLPQNHAFDGFEVEHDFPTIGRKIMLLNARRIRNPGNNSELILLAIGDITERKRAEEALRESEESYRTLFESAPMAVFVCDLNAVIQQYNSRAVELWGRAPTRGVERHCGSVRLWLPDGTLLPHAQSPVVGVLRTGIPANNVEFSIERPDGSRLPVLVNFAVLKNEREEIVGSIISFMDIAEIKRAANQLRQLAADLSDSDRRKNEFLAMLAHELRNPLAPISNAVHILRLQKNETPPQQKARITIERQVASLTRLIDDLLEVSRISTGRVQLRHDRVLVSGIVERAVETVRPLMDQHRHELTVSLPSQPIWLNADAARLEQVVVNLLTNAAKYTDEGGRVWLTIERSSRNGAAPAECVLRVRDTGVGIAPELLPRVFDLFTQAERSLDRSQGGLGIGLALVKQLVEMHQGSVEAFSTLGIGSEFVVRLLVESTPASEASASLKETTESAGPSLRVLVVDDNVDSAHSLEMLLEIFHHQVRTAHDGPTGLEAALDFRPNVVLLDIGLPSMDGYQVAKKMRQQPDLENVMLVAMTGYGQESDRQRSREAGFDHHLVKPVDFGKVQQILAAVSERAT